MNCLRLGNIFLDERRQAARFLQGKGIEIGACHLPIDVDTQCCHVQYVDKLTAPEVMALFPELHEYSIVTPDIICDVEKKGLSLFGDGSLDFVIASHLIEHLPNPLGFIKDCHRALRRNGVLYLVVPDKNFTFDRERQTTPLAHIVEDMKHDVHDVDPGHLLDFLVHVRKTAIPDAVEERNRLFKHELERSIHVHVWTWEGVVEFLRYMTINEGVTWELCEVYLPKKDQDEVIFVLKKTDVLPEKAVACFDSSLKTLLARENAMKAVIDLLKEKEAVSQSMTPAHGTTKVLHSADNGAQSNLLPSLGLRKIWNRIKRNVPVPRSQNPVEGRSNNVERPRPRSAYKATWNDLSDTEERAKMHVTGYVEEDRIRIAAEETKDVLLATVGIGPNDVVLEIGCGIGRVGRVVAPLCKQWIGCDVSNNMLQHAAERMKDCGNARFVELTGYDLKPVADDSIDVVYSTVVFMHLDEWDRYNYVLEARRVLRPNGRIYIDNFNLCGEEGWSVFEQHRSIPPENRPAHISKSSTSLEIEMYLKKTGFQSVMIQQEKLWVRGWGRK